MGVRPDAWSLAFDYQLEGVARAVRARDFSLWWACGSGKTFAALLWALAEPGPKLVFTRSAAREQWAFDEIPLFLLPPAEGGPDPFVLRPLSERRAGDEALDEYLARAGTSPLVIAGWSALQSPDTLTELSKVIGPSVKASRRPSVVWDEAHTLKDPQHVKAQAEAHGGRSYRRRDTIAATAARLALYARRRLALTATPIPDRRRDLWAQLNAVKPGSVGRSGHDWFVEFCGAYRGEYGWITDGESNTEALAAYLSGVSHVVTTETVWRGLPPCTRDLITIPRNQLDPEDPAARAAVFAALKELGGVKGGAARADRTAKLRAAEFAAAATRKRTPATTLALDVLRRPGGAAGGGKPAKVLVFTGLRRDVDVLADAIRTALPGANVWAADGATPPREREEIRRRYMDDDSAPACIVGTGASWGESANLQRSDLQIIVSLPWTWGQIRQWEGRARRKRQDRPLRIVYLFAEGTVDTRVFPHVRRKLNDAATLLPDQQIDDVRAVLAGGTDEELIDGFLDDFIGSDRGAR